MGGADLCVQGKRNSDRDENTVPSVCLGFRVRSGHCSSQLEAGSIGILRYEGRDLEATHVVRSSSETKDTLLIIKPQTVIG